MTYQNLAGLVSAASPTAILTRVGGRVAVAGGPLPDRAADGRSLTMTTNSAQVLESTREVRDSLSRLRCVLRDYDPKLASDFGSIAFPVHAALDLVDDCGEHEED